MRCARKEDISVLHSSRGINHYIVALAPTLDPIHFVIVGP
jgi:hypothetical protein